MSDFKHIVSPFKFLEAYNFSDSANFFGRERETLSLVRMLADSPLAILFGPSGSGKTSLINSGFSKTLNLSNRQLVTVRRGDNYINSIGKNLFNSGCANFAELISSIHDKSNFIHEHRSIQSDLSTSYRKDRDRVWNGEIDRKEYQKRVQVFQNEKNKIKSEINKKKKEIRALENSISNGLGLHQTALMRYLILDQFEELLVLGSREEAEQVGIFLQILSRIGLPIKTIVAIREEFLGELEFLEKFIPNLFSCRVKIGHPNEESVREILNKSFKSFNINQIKINPKKSASEIPLSEEEMKERIDSIIHQLVSVEKNVTTLHFNKKEFYLPFLQIYLDRLYKVDYARTYRNKREKSGDDLLPIEFEVDEINHFGSINKVLEDYMDRIYESMKESASFTQLMALRRASSPILKVLKFLTTPNFTKRTDVKYGKTKGGIKLLDEQLDKDLQLSLWHKIDNKNRAGLSFLLEQMEASRLIKTNDGSLELSHDILARIVNSIPLADDIPDILRRNFNDQFNLFKADESSSSKAAYLSEYLINKISQEDLDYIIRDDDEQMESKRNYYILSKNYRNRKILRGKWIYRSLLSILFLTTVAFAISWHAAENAKESVDKLQNDSKNSGQIFRNIGSAYYVGKNNVTAAYDTIRGVESRWTWLSDLINSQASKFRLRAEYINDLERNFYKRPFFYYQIHIEKGNHILETKSRILGKGEILLFAKSRDSLLAYKVSLANRQDSVIYTTSEAVTSFEPFYTDKRNCHVLYSAKSGLSIIDVDGKSTRLFSDKEVQNMLEIEQIDSNLFLGISENGSQLLIVNLEDSSFQSQKTEIIDMENVEVLDFGKFYITGYQPRTTSAKQERRTRWIYQYSIRKKQIAENRKLDIGKMVGDAKASLMYDQNSQKLYLSGGKVIYELEENLGSPNLIPRISTQHEEGITSFDIRGEEFLVGSNDRTASLYFDRELENVLFNEQLQREFIAHTDCILNVSFVKTDIDTSDFILTSGQDGSIKFWEISPIEIASTKIVNATNVNQLDYVNKKIVVAFQTRESDKSGLIYSFSPELKPDTIYYYRGFRKRGSRLHHLNTFAFYDSDFIVGNLYDQHVVSAKYIDDSTSTLILKMNASIQHVKIQNDKMIICTDNGAYFTKNFKSGETYTSSDSINFDTVLQGLKINTADIHPNLDKVLLTSDNKRIYLWDLIAATVDTLTFHTDRVKDACFSSTGEFFVSCSWDNTAVIWTLADLSKYVPLRDQIINVHSSDVEDIDIYGDSLIATASSDNTIQIHRIKVNEDEKASDKRFTIVQEPSLMHHNYSVRAVTFGETDSVLYSADKTGIIKKWNWRNYRTVIDKRRFSSND